MLLENGPYVITKVPILYENNIYPALLAAPLKSMNATCASRGVFGCSSGGWNDCSIGANPDSPRLWSQLHLAGAPGVCVRYPRRGWGTMDSRNSIAEVSSRSVVECSCCVSKTAWEWLDGWLFYFCFCHFKQFVDFRRICCLCIPRIDPHTQKCICNSFATLSLAAVSISSK